MANPATVADLEARWRPLSSDESSVAQALLDDAWEILLARVPLLSNRLDDASLSEGLVIAVETAMVLRVLKNPDGKRSESIDDYTWVRDNAVSAGLLYLDGAELLQLSPDRSDAYTISPFGEPGFSARPLNWFELNL